MRSFSGAFIRRVIDRSHACVPEHAHDWPVLSLFVIGSYWNQTELGEQFISGPSAIFYGARAAHRNKVAGYGFEQVEIELDPDWLGGRLLPPVAVMSWVGGACGREARELARACAEESEGDIRARLQGFLERAGAVSKQDPPGWIGTIMRRLSEDTSSRIADLAAEAGRHPSWVGSAYRHATGEGLQEAASRLRVERATRLLRETGQPYASIALEAGFCDQSHMNRTFRRVLGRTPSVVREERRSFRAT